MEEKLSIEYRKTNFVIITRTLGRIMLLDAYKKLGYGQFNPRSYSALTQKMKNDKLTIIMFSTGVISCMGSMSYYGALKYLFKLKTRLGLVILNVKVSNVVVTFNVNNEHVNLDRLYEQNKNYATYNKEIFPSLSLGVPDSKIICNIFSTGKVVIAGCNDEDKIRDAIEYVVEKIKLSM